MFTGWHTSISRSLLWTTFSAESAWRWRASTIASFDESSSWISWRAHFSPSWTSWKLTCVSSFHRRERLNGATIVLCLSKFNAIAPGFKLQTCQLISLLEMDNILLPVFSLPSYPRPLSTSPSSWNQRLSYHPPRSLCWISWRSPRNPKIIIIDTGKWLTYH